MDNSNSICVGGTVIQRSFVPRGLGTVINIATVPISEIHARRHSSDDSLLLKTAVSEILGSPIETIIDDNEYQKISNLFSNNKIRKIFRPKHRGMFWYDFYEEYLYDLEKEYKQELKDDENGMLHFSRDTLSLLISPQENSQYLMPFFPVLGRSTDEILRNAEININPDAFQTGLKCYLSGMVTPEKHRNLIHDIEKYDIPIGQSPKTQSDSLLKLIETSKKMCLVPMVAAGTMGISQLGQGAYVAAVLTVGTGSAMTLVLIGTLAVGDLLVRHMIHNRPNSNE